jgi:hypothetical protein
LELAAEPDLPLREQFTRFRALVSSDMDWVNARKDRFRARASWAKILALVVTAASTVVLGLTGIPDRAAIALPMVALDTVISALEPFFNWRSRWILMEEAQYRLNRLRDEMDYYLVTTPTSEIQKPELERFFRGQQDIWSDVSKRWIEYREADRVPKGQRDGQIAS